MIGVLSIPAAIASAAPSDKAKGGEAGRSGESAHFAEAEEEPAGDTQSASGPAHVCDGDSGGHSDSGNGANTDGDGNEYHNTCPAGPSQNGEGDGAASGRPCMGCVGQADDKNPPGQADNGGDRNNGYECDGNRGIGKGNPAHTGCTLTSPPENPPPKSPPPKNPPPNSSSTPGKVLASVSVAVGQPAAAEVLGVVINRAPGDPAVAAAPLARTGAPLGTMFQSGVIAVLLGAFLWALSGLQWRRRVVEVPFEL